MRFFILIQSYKQFLKFGLIGVIGFAVEALIITLLGNWMLWDAMTSRCFSFPSAVLVTWALNRQYNFNSRNNVRTEGARYFLTQLLGAWFNVGTFVAFMHTFPQFNKQPIIGLAVGAIAGLIVNFCLSKFFVFKQRKPKHDV